MPLQPTTTADNNDFNMISELSTSSLTPTQIRTGVENGFNFIKSITNYGTLPNLNTDSTSAFLMAQISGGMIYIPNGTYKANIVINSDSMFVGESLRNVIIEPYDISKPVISIDRTAVDALQHNFGFIDNITFKGISGVGIGLSLAAKAPAVIKDMKLGRLVFKDLDTGIYTNSSTAAGEIYQLTADVLYFERCTTYAMNCIDLNQSTFNAIHIDDTSTASNRFKLSGNNNKIGHLYTSGGVELVSGNGLVIDLLRFEAVKASRLVTNSNAMIKYNMTSSTIKTIMIQTCGESGTKLNSVLFLTKLGLVIGEINIFGTNYITYLLDNLLSATGSGLSIGKSDVITQYSLPSTYSTLSTIVKTKKMILRNILHTNGNVYDYVGTSRSIKRVDTLADLRAIIVPDDTVHVTGYYTKGDGAFESNNFEWDSTSVEYDNGGTIIKLTAVVTGRYKLNTKRFISPEMFGTIGDGIVDDTVKLINCFGTSLPVISNGKSTYKVSGSLPITIKNDVEFNGSYIMPVNFTSEILIHNHTEILTIRAGDPYFDHLTANGGTIVKGSRLLPLLDDRYSGYYAILTTSQDFYMYRGTNIKRKFFTVLNREKQSHSPMDYDMDASTITSIELFKITDKRLKVSGINVLENVISNYTLVNIYGTNIEYSNSYFKKIGSNQLSPYLRISVEDSAYVTLNNVSTNTPILTTNKEYSYTVSLKNSYELDINGMISDGEGWGSVGNNNCGRITFSKCKLNRIDFHNPFRDYLKILDCVVGDWGLSLSGIGDLIIDDTEFLCKAGTVATIIALRSDVGFVDGDLRMTNCTYKGAGLRSWSFVSASLSADAGVAVGSPIPQKVFNNIIIDNFIDSTDLNQSYHFLNIGTAGKFIAPSYISLNNVRVKNTGAFIYFKFNNLISNQNLGLTGVLPNYYPYSTVINITNSNFNKYLFQERGLNHMLGVTLTGCTGTNLGGAEYYIQSTGFYVLDKCQVKLLSTTFGGYTAEDFLDIKIVNSIINNPNTTMIMFDETKDQEIRLANNTIFYREVTHPTQIGKCIDGGNRIINRL